MQASHINAQQGSLLLILGTTMQFGYDPVQTLCTAHARARNTPPQPVHCLHAAHTRANTPPAVRLSHTTCSQPIRGPYTSLRTAHATHLHIAGIAAAVREAQKGQEEAHDTLQSDGCARAGPAKERPGGEDQRYEPLRHVSQVGHRRQHEVARSFPPGNPDGVCDPVAMRYTFRVIRVSNRCGRLATVRTRPAMDACKSTPDNAARHHRTTGRNITDAAPHQSSTPPHPTPPHPNPLPRIGAREGYPRPGVCPHGDRGHVGIPLGGVRRGWHVVRSPFARMQAPKTAATGLKIRHPHHCFVPCTNRAGLRENGTGPPPEVRDGHRCSTAAVPGLPAIRVAPAEH